MDFSIKDMFRNHVETVSNGKNTVVYDDYGNPNIMYVLRKHDMKEYGYADFNGISPVFIINGKVVDEVFVSKYPNSYGDGNVPISYPGMDTAYGLTPKEIDDAVRKKGKGWKNFSSIEFTTLSIMSTHRGNSGKDGYVRACDKYMSGRYIGYKYEEFGGRYNPRYNKTGTLDPSTSHDNTEFGVFGMNQERWNWTSGACVDENGKYWFGGEKSSDTSKIHLNNNPTWFASFENMVETPFYVNATSGFATNKTCVAGYEGQAFINTDSIKPSYERALFSLVGCVPIPRLAKTRHVRLCVPSQGCDKTVLVMGGCQSDYAASTEEKQWDMYTPYIMGGDNEQVLKVTGWQCIRTTYVPELA